MSQIADFDHNVFSEMDSEADKALLVKFYHKSVQDKAKSDEEGRPVFIEKEYIEIRFAGNRTDAVARPATDRDKQRFARHYEAFKQRIEMPEVGTPLTEWPAISRSQAEELAFFNIKTVEQLASVTDNNAHQFMGFYGLRDKAKTFLKAGKSSAEAAKLQEELDDAKAENEALKARMDALEAKLADAPAETVESDTAKPTKRKRRATRRTKKE